MFCAGYQRQCFQLLPIQCDIGCEFVINDSYSYHFETESHSVAQAAISAHCNLSLPGSWDYRRVPPRPTNFFVFLVEKRFHHVDQAGLELLTSSALLSLASQSAGITGVSHCTQPFSFLNFRFARYMCSFVTWVC